MILEIEVVAHGTARRIRLPAKIDTGADITVVPDTAVDSLRLVEYGSRIVHVVNHAPYEAPTYRADVDVEGIQFKSLQVVGHHKPYVLIGRDILNQLKLIADGPNETFELIHPKS
ncbi:MAG TPA: hypothetical protein VM008_22065 [Phycisphaerae bacterium]|nr:hypothetical protein [Phycisphaerae bacterium]